MKTVRVTIEGGVIQHIDCPRGGEGNRSGLRHLWR
jgi:hypothetical protein